MGEIVVSRSEKFCAVTAQNGTALGITPIFPSSTVMAWLAKLTVAFDRIEWLSCQLVWKPFVGTSKSGSLAMGVDWDSSFAANSITRDKVQAATPVYESPIWQSGTMRLPAKMLMTRKAYSLHSVEAPDKQPGQVLWSLAGVDDDLREVGEIWITYKVRLSGTTA